MPKTAKFEFDPRLAAILGETFKTPERALIELVNNAWDADATEVRISIPFALSGHPIRVNDNGPGMTEREVRSYYLRVGRNKIVDRGTKTPIYSRIYKGRKGIGKFAMFVFANQVEVVSSSKKIETKFSLNSSMFSDSSKEMKDISIPIETSDAVTETGVKVTISDFIQTMHVDTELLKYQLINEYGRENNFRIYVNEELVSVKDVSKNLISEEIYQNGKPVGRITFAVLTGDKSIKKPGIVFRKNGAIISRSENFGFDNDPLFPKGLEKKVYGEIEIYETPPDTDDTLDFLDDSEIRKVLVNATKPKLFDATRSEYKNAFALAKARQQQRHTKQLESLPEHKRYFVNYHIERVVNKFYGDTDKTDEIVDVLIDALEKDYYWLVLQKISESRDQTVEEFSNCLKEFSLVDNATMASLIGARLSFLDYFERLIFDRNVPEKDIHTFIEQNLWLVGIEPLTYTSNKTLKSNIQHFTDSLYNGRNPLKRPDLVLLVDYNNNYVVIEFKEPGHMLTRMDEAQLLQYISELRKYLPGQHSFRGILIGGRIAPEFYDPNPAIEVHSYIELASNARTKLKWITDKLEE